MVITPKSEVIADTQREIIGILYGLQTEAEPSWDIWFSTIQDCIDTVLRVERVSVPVELKDAKTKVRVDHLIDALVKLRAKDRAGAANAIQALMTE
jgi:hypothetical protein